MQSTSQTPKPRGGDLGGSPLAARLRPLGGRYVICNIGRMREKEMERKGMWTRGLEGDSKYLGNRGNWIGKENKEQQDFKS
jgi:hypothetical protein